jgi:hypothetical protein
MLAAPKFNDLLELCRLSQCVTGLWRMRFPRHVANGVSNDEGEEKYLSYLFGKIAH